MRERQRFEARDGIENEPSILICRCSKTRNHILTPAVTPTYSEIPIVADRREQASSATAAESNCKLCAVLSGELGADVGLFQLDVDHTGNRVGAVQRRCTVLEHLDAIDCVERDRAAVDETALAVVAQRIGHHALAVDQGERAAHRQAAQRDAGGTGGEGPVKPWFSVPWPLAARLRRTSETFVLAGAFQILIADDLHGTRGLLVGALDHGTGDNHRLQSHLG